MRYTKTILTLVSLIVSVVLSSSVVADSARSGKNYNKGQGHSVQLGPRPFFLVNDMDEGPLKAKLQGCSEGPFKGSDFSIGHRGAALQFPEHTKESYTAAARMGAGIMECDVTFTKDKQLVCRHSQCDLHTTTNILATPLGVKCSQPFSPAEYDASGNLITPASAKCCTSDINLAQFKSLQGKMDAANPRATTVEDYLNATPSWRTDLYASHGTLLSHRESIDLFKSLGVKMTPELKSPSVPMPFDGLTQQDYAQQMIDEYKDAGVPASKVWVQSFNVSDVLYWINNEPQFGKQAVYLDDADSPLGLPGLAELESYAAQGINIVAPPMWALVSLDQDNKIVPSEYAMNAKAAGLDIITWTLERSGTLTDGGGWYYQTVNSAINNSGDTMNMLDVLAQDVGILGIFSDWPATVTYYANCMGLK
jgi:glycerophosphoryl diester phosphodiesterase